MAFKELNVGDVFRIAGEEQRWRKVSPAVARCIGAEGEILWSVPSATPGSFRDKEIEVLERADTSEIRRSGNTLALKGGDVTLQLLGAWQIIQFEPGDKVSLFALVAETFETSTVEQPTEETALGFSIRSGATHLGRPGGSEVFAYKGRVYARATKKEVLGKAQMGGYKLIRKIDGAKRVVIAGILTLPGEFALYDIIMEHFGPDTVVK